jgi:hypothetical protein
MKGCANYTALCKAGSKVAQCSSQAPAARLPLSGATRQSVLAACGDHTMPSCSKCSSLTACPDPLEAYADVCREHPTMAQCSAYHTWCSSSAGAFAHYCDAGGEELLPAMKMYFHQRWAAQGQPGGGQGKRRRRRPAPGRAGLACSGAAVLQCGGAVARARKAAPPSAAPSPLLPQV